MLLPVRCRKVLTRFHYSSVAAVNTTLQAEMSIAQGVFLEALWVLIHDFKGFSSLTLVCRQQLDFRLSL